MGVYTVSDDGIVILDCSVPLDIALEDKEVMWLVIEGADPYHYMDDPANDYYQIIE
jgi:hypothetical protein